MSSRLDRELVVRGLARSRQQAQEAIRCGTVRVNSEVVTRPAMPVSAEALIEIEQIDHYVSRAAHKLRGALDELALSVPSRVLDAGASTGGFTQVVLERGAERVYAVDVGHGQLAEIIRRDPRVVVRERLNLRDLTVADLESQPVELVVADVSFISLTLLLPSLFSVLAANGRALLLVKPQFEVGRSGLDDRGVVRDPRLQKRAVDGVIAAAHDLGWQAHGRAASRLPGENGNVEFFVEFVPLT